MAIITFDTLECVETLIKNGLPREQAEGIIKAIQKSQESLVTREYLDIALNPIKLELAIIKWMLGLILAGIVSLVVKILL